MPSPDDADANHIPKDGREVRVPGAGEEPACAALEAAAVSLASPPELEPLAAGETSWTTPAVEADGGSASLPVNEGSGIAVGGPLEDAAGIPPRGTFVSERSVHSTVVNEDERTDSRPSRNPRSGGIGGGVSSTGENTPATAAATRTIEGDQHLPQRVTPVVNATANAVPIKGRSGDAEGCGGPQNPEIWDFPPRRAVSTNPPPSSPRADYVAAGVLPFCILGGDLLFLLGQQLRFQSRTKSGNSEKAEGPLEGCKGLGARDPPRARRGGGSSHVGDGELRQETSARKPRLGPRPKLSSPPPSPRVAPQAHVLRASPEVMSAPGSEKAHPRDTPESHAHDDSREDCQPESVHDDSTGLGFSKPSAIEESLIPARQASASTSPSRPSPKVTGSSRGGDSAVTFAGGQNIPHDTARGHLKSGTSTGSEEKVESLAGQVCGGQAGAWAGRVDPPATAPTVYVQSKPVASSSAPHREGCQGRRGGDGGRDGNNQSHPGDEDMVLAGLLWSDFGGAREEGDVDAEGTASREFAEESLGLFHGVRLERDSVARSQAAMESLLRDPTMKGKKVFECRNGGYVMFVAAVDFVPDIMMKLARKEVMEGDGRCHAGGNGGGSGASSDGADEGSAPSPRLTEKTDFAWVPASSLLGAMRESRHKSTKRVVVKLGGCRFLRLFHKFVISLWGLDLPAVVKAASTPAHGWKRPLPAPRALLLKPGAVAGVQDAHKGKGSRGGTGRGREIVPVEKCVDGDKLAPVEDVGGVPRSREGLPEGVRCAIRGIDCIRPSFLSGRKRTNLGIIDDRGPYRGSPRCARPRRTSAGDHWFGPEGGAASYRVGDLRDAMDGSESGDDNREHRGGREQSSTPGRDHRGGDSIVGLGMSARAGRGGRSGAACRKKRRRCKEARHVKAAAAAAAGAEASSPRPVSTPRRHGASA